MTTPAANHYVAQLLFVLCTTYPARTAADEDSEDTESVAVLSFFIVAIVIGIFTFHLLAFTRVPYTALLLVSASLTVDPITALSSRLPFHWLDTA